MVSNIKQTKDEVLRIRVPRSTYVQISARAEQEDSSLSTVARDLLGRALGETRPKQSVEGQQVVAARDAVLLQIDALNDLLDLISGNGSEEAVVLAMESAIGFSRWAELKASRLGSTTEAIYRQGMKS